MLRDLLAENTNETEDDIRVLPGEPTKDRPFTQRHPIAIWKVITDPSASTVERIARSRQFLGKWCKLDARVADVKDRDLSEQIIVEIKVSEPFSFTISAEFSSALYGKRLRHLDPAQDRVRFIGKIETLDPSYGEFVLTDCELREI